MSPNVSQRIGQCCGTGGVVTKLPPGGGALITNYGSDYYLKDLKIYFREKKSWFINPRKKVSKSKKIIFKTSNKYL
jgi:hypothetical protein